MPDATIHRLEAHVAHPSTRVALADDRALLRGSLSALLRREPDIELVRAGSDDGHDHDPDVLVLDLVAVDSTTIRAISRMRTRTPQTQIVVLTGELEAASAPGLIDAGVLAIVAKEAVDRDLPAAVRAAARGERFLSDRVEAAMRAGTQPNGRGRLSARETEVLRLLALGHTSVAIAGELHLSPRTVETHRARIHRKLELASRAELVRYALLRGLLRI